MVGLGLALERNSSERITFVEQVIPGFAAHQSGQFQMGDVVVAVDHQPVEELELDCVRARRLNFRGRALPACWSSSWPSHAVCVRV